MTIAREGGSSIATANGVTQLTINYSPTAGRFLTCSGAFVAYPNSGVLSTVVDSSSTGLTVKKNTNATTVGGYDNHALVAYRENIPSGLTYVRLNFTDNHYGHASVDEWSGVKTSGAFDTQVDAEQSSTSLSLGSGNITLGDANGLVIGACFGDDSGDGSWNTYSGWTQIWQWGDTTSNAAAQSVYRVGGGSTGPYSLTWYYDQNNSYMTSVLVSFLPAAEASGPHTRNYSPDAMGMRTVLRM